MKHLFAAIFTFVFFASAPAFALMEDYPSVKLQGLDKSVGRTTTFEAKVGSTIQYGSLFIKIDACRKTPPIEKPESAAFLQIWEIPPGEDKSAWVFSGWMFASSPALSAMDHPVYDVWVLDCLGKEQPNDEAKNAETDKQADQTSLSAPAATGEETTTPSDAVPQTENQEQTPPAAEQQEEPIPTDSEAEEEPAEDTSANPDPAQAQVQQEQPESSSAKPDDGLTAYDFMKKDNQQ